MFLQLNARFVYSEIQINIVTTHYSALVCKIMCTENEYLDNNFWEMIRSTWVVDTPVHTVYVYILYFSIIFIDMLILVEDEACFLKNSISLLILTSRNGVPQNSNGIKKLIFVSK